MSTLREKIKFVVTNRITNYRYRLSDIIELNRSRKINISNISSVCLTLGPYRNLTTLTAFILSVHPNCQVLNHAAKRIFGRRKIDFLQDFSQEKLNRFIQFALRISTSGKGGSVGGSITHSHAFRTNQTALKSDITDSKENNKNAIECLFWKESLRTSNIIKNRELDLEKLFNIDKRLRFLLPIRNPLDCAISNLRTGHVKLFRGIKQDATIQDVIIAIIDEILWFADLENKFPDRFFHFYEYNISQKMLNELANFLQIDTDEDWIDSIVSDIKVKPGYLHDKDLIEYYKDKVTSLSSGYPEFEQGLLKFFK